MNSIVVTSTKQNIKFGYEGEDNVTKIIFPYDESWLEYGEGNFEVRILRCGDEVAYTATEVVDDRQAMTLTMTVTDIELSVRGRGEMQLCYVCPDSIKKSPIYQYTVNRSIDYKYAVDPPDGSIIASVEKSLSEIKNTTNRLSNSVISIESSINDVNSQIDNINNKISEFDEEIDSVGEVGTKVDNLETSVESINGRINTAEGNINENAESISNLNESVTELENRKVTDLETSGGKSDSGKYLTVGTDGKVKATSLTIPTITVDTSLSTTSKNPVQNKVIKTELNNINSNIATCNTEISKINGSLRDYTFDSKIVYNDFAKGYQLQTYHVGSKITIKPDETGVRAVNTTPIYFSRKTFLPAPKEYEFFLCVVTSKTDFTVLVENPSYFTYDWIQAQSYIMLQIRRKDKAVLTDADMEIINLWIDFQYKVFELDDLKRFCALKKQFYSGNGSSYSNNHYLFLMAHITDIHSDVQRYANFRKFLDENASVIDCAICTGDYVDNQAEAQWTAMNEVSGNVNILQVVGNHDAGHQAGDTLIGDGDLVAKFDIETNTGKMYYYVDYDAIRVIVLNQFEGSTKGTYVYNSDEITWLLSVLDDSIVNGKHVIIACHMPDTFPVANSKGFYQRYNRSYPRYPTMLSGLEEVINAFKHGITVTKTLSGNIDVVHTFANAGDFVCWICGHYHGDYIGYSATYSDQLYLNGNCGVCQPAPFKYTFMGETFSDLARIPKTVSEDCFNVYAFDFKERLVKVAKIGANINDILEPRQAAVYGMDGE